MFHIDPVDVLKTDYFTWAVRLAALNVAVEELEKANQKKKE